MTLDAQIDGNLPAILGDAERLRQVLMNLALNAMEAGPLGGRVRVTARSVGREVLLAVDDSGPGIPSELSERIFEPFFTTKEQGKGTGLGLSTVFGIVPQSGGSILVESEPGRGATFKVYLPMVDAEVDAPRAEVAFRTLQGTETILLVEDEEQVRTIAVRVLRRYGYRIMEAQHPGEALLLCEKEAGAIDLLVTDVVMPHMSGPELARRVTITRPQLKVLFVSGYTDDSMARHGVLESGMAFLQKPFTPDLLTRKVRQVLDGAALVMASAT
jgi:CheY-like chemotaxis protein/anti-sigma regulatory factor (Ser/Thr protein kinase)